MWTPSVCGCVNTTLTVRSIGFDPRVSPMGLERGARSEIPGGCTDAPWDPRLRAPGPRCQAPAQAQ